LLVVAYIFDWSASKTRVPSVVLLLLVGWMAKNLLDFFSVSLPDASSVLPLLGTLGLILIVLEGSMELKLHTDKRLFIRTSLLSALVPLLVFSFLLAFVFRYTSGLSFRHCLANAIPLSIISSAVAIPTVKHLSGQVKEFVIYESSISDIIGVIFFNFIVLNSDFGVFTFVRYGANFLLELVISFITSVLLVYFLKKVEHNIKFMPILAVVILIYMISKVYNLPPLVFVMLFGLFLSNLNRVKHLRALRWLKRLHPEEMKDDIFKFKEMTEELSFLVRALFFLLFGFMMETADIINLHTLPWALGIVASIYLIRMFYLKISRQPLQPLLFIAPRGLITILLFLSIEPTARVPQMNNALIIQIVIITALIMMTGMIAFGNKKT